VQDGQPCGLNHLGDHEKFTSMVPGVNCFSKEELESGQAELWGVCPMEQLSLGIRCDNHDCVKHHLRGFVGFQNRSKERLRKQTLANTLAAVDDEMPPPMPQEGGFDVLQEGGFEVPLMDDDDDDDEMPPPMPPMMRESTVLQERGFDVPLMNDDDDDDDDEMPPPMPPMMRMMRESTVPLMDDDDDDDDDEMPPPMPPMMQMMRESTVPLMDDAPPPMPRMMRESTVPLMVAAVLVAKTDELEVLPLLVCRDAKTTNYWGTPPPLVRQHAKTADDMIHSAVLAAVLAAADDELGLPPPPPPPLVRCDGMTAYDIDRSAELFAVGDELGTSPPLRYDATTADYWGTPPSPLVRQYAKTAAEIALDDDSEIGHGIEAEPYDDGEPPLPPPPLLERQDAMVCCSALGQPQDIVRRHSPFSPRDHTPRSPNDTNLDKSPFSLRYLGTLKNQDAQPCFSPKNTPPPTPPLVPRRPLVIVLPPLEPC